MDDFESLHQAHGDTFWAALSDAAGSRRFQKLSRDDKRQLLSWLLTDVARHVAFYEGNNGTVFEVFHRAANVEYYLLLGRRDESFADSVRKDIDELP